MDRATETWNHIERLLTEECGLPPDQGLISQRSNCINAIRNGLDFWKDQFDAASTAASEYSEFWEQHNGDFDMAGNYIPHSQIDGDLRAERKKVGVLYPALFGLVEMLHARPDIRHLLGPTETNIIENARSVLNPGREG
jgi:hypothetical protein